ncbi:iron uptake porin [Pantanalinema rosaneae CENA516]|uniref:iron uptake porin n=1 Tax=Pantanalinema rosaneae TaxID=1620701 RepID=UPI003D6EE511
MMSKTQWKLLLATPAILSAAFVTSVATTAAQAAESSGLSSAAQVEAAAPEMAAIESVRPMEIAQAANAEAIDQVGSYAAEGAGMGAIDQVTSVSQLTDVRPTDWAFQALQSLVERYGCIVGYPDRTYRGNRSLSRYEFAAGLNACMDRITELINTIRNDYVSKEDLLVLQRLQEEFGAELAALRGRVDGLETRTATLERQQFSTTTKLNGEAIFAISDTFGDAVDSDDDDSQTTFSDRVRLNFDTSFSGRDRLKTRLNAGNIPNYTGITGTQMSRLSFDSNTDNAVEVDKLNYRFPLADGRLRIQIDAINNEYTSDGLVTTLSPFESSGNGAVSRFGRFNPIFRAGNPSKNGAAGLTLAYQFSDNFRLEGGYTGDVGGGGSSDPSPKNGLFNGSYSALAQLVYSGGNFGAGLTYARSYYPGGSVNLTGSTGGFNATAPFGTGVATSANAFGVQLQYKLSPTFIIGGWYSAMFADQESGGNGDSTIMNGALYLAFPDLGKRGNLAGLIVGVPPKVTGGDNRNDDTSIHVEALYRYRISDNIAITPGVFVIFNPNHNNDNNTQVVGVLRTTFSF